MHKIVSKSAKICPTAYNYNSKNSLLLMTNLSNHFSLIHFPTYLPAKISQSFLFELLLKRSTFSDKFIKLHFYHFQCPQSHTFSYLSLLKVETINRPIRASKISNSIIPQYACGVHRMIYYK